MEVAKGVRRCSLGVTNWYLVEEGGRTVLVDAGAPKDWSLLLSTIAERGLALNDLDAILLTHAHPDHTGFAEQARSKAGARVWVHEADVAVAKGAKQPKNEAGVVRYLVHPATYRTAFSLMSRGAGRLVPIAEVSAFSDGETVDVPGRPRVVHTPGHTDGHSCLLFEDRDALMCGDALVTLNPLTGRHGPQIMPAGLNRDSGQALRSLDRLKGFGDTVLLPGHGDPFRDGAAEAVRLARAAGRS